MIQQQTEEWRDVPGYEGLYQVSNCGRVRSFHRDGCILQPSPNPKGYLNLTLSKHGVQETATVHKLVALAFIGQCPEGCEINHIDLDKSNNVPSNLEYLTKKANLLHADKAGALRIRGSQNAGSKLVESDVYRIREMVRQGISTSLVAEMFGVSAPSISNIKAGRSWRHLTAPTDGDNQS